MGHVLLPGESGSFIKGVADRGQLETLEDRFELRRDHISHLVAPWSGAEWSRSHRRHVREEPDADPVSPDPLDQLPVGDVNLSSAPEYVLREMLESFRLQVRYDKVASWATCRVALREALDQLLTDSPRALRSTNELSRRGTGATSTYVAEARGRGRFPRIPDALDEEIAHLPRHNESRSLLLDGGQKPEAGVSLRNLSLFSPISPRVSPRRGRRGAGPCGARRVNPSSPHTCGARLRPGFDAWCDPGMSFGS